MWKKKEAEKSWTEEGEKEEDLSGLIILLDTAFGTEGEGRGKELSEEGAPLSRTVRPGYAKKKRRKRKGSRPG